MQVRCIETGRVYKVYRVQEPDYEIVRFSGPVFRKLPGWYIIEDAHGNLAGRLSFEDAEVI